MSGIKLFDEHFLEIQHDEENGWLYADWKGYQSNDSIKTGVNRLIELMPERGVFKILNDNTHTLGIWIGVSTWLAFDALPRAGKAGMKFFAHVHGPSRLSRISAEASLALLKQATPDLRAFDDMDAAMQWLRGRN